MSADEHGPVQVDREERRAAGRRHLHTSPEEQRLEELAGSEGDER